MWPTHTEYFEAVQLPWTRFADPDLQRGQVVTHRQGLPVCCSGNFTVVFRVRGQQGEWAVKCFTRPAENLRQRYAAVAEHLQSWSIPYMVPFEYLEPGIRVSNQWYPVVKMEWVEGQTLREFVEGQLGRKGDLEALLYWLWCLSRDMPRYQMAHGNIQHGNVLVVEDGCGGV